MPHSRRWRLTIKERIVENARSVSNATNLYFECGSIKCAYCDCPAGVHFVDQCNYIFLFNYGLITLKRALPFLVSLYVARNYKLLLPNSTGLRAVNSEFFRTKSECFSPRFSQLLGVIFLIQF